MTRRPRYLDAIEAHSLQTPTAEAVTDGAASLTYGRLWAAVQEAARWLLAQGIRPGDRVAIAIPPSRATIVWMFGAMAADAVAAPVHVSLKPGEAATYLRTVGARLAVTTPALAGLFDPSLVDRVTILEQDDGTSATRLPRSSTTEAPAAPPSRLHSSWAMMFGTGGTTGSPKAALWSHEALWMYAASCSAAMEVRRNDVEVFFAPMSHIAVVTSPFATLFSGGAVRFLPRLDVAAVVEQLGSGSVSRIYGAPTALSRIISSPDFDPRRMAAVRRVLFGSTRSEPDLPDRLRAAFPQAEWITGYGATEFGAVARLRSWEAADGTDLGVGRPVPGVRILVVGPDDRILPAGEIGELVVRAPWQMLGYYGDSDVRRAFVHGGVRTGDLGELDERGYLHLRGRSKDLVITGGENVYPVEVEDALSAHPDVAEVAVVGIPDGEWGERVEAAVVLTPSAAARAAQGQTTALIGFCRERLAGYKVPKRVHLVDALPLTSTLKVDKRALRELLTGGQPAAGGSGDG